MPQYSMSQIGRAMASYGWDNHHSIDEAVKAKLSNYTQACLLAALVELAKDIEGELTSLKMELAKAATDHKPQEGHAIADGMLKVLRQRTGDIRLPATYQTDFYDHMDGPARQSMIRAAYRGDIAWLNDVTPERLREIDGFGPVRIASVMRWKDSLGVVNE